ncbi:MAG: hypothetical protein OEV93_05050, partial [Candidatus Moranbacteria bacterium]|nr:hypothetical protein [Candidatus Moranbacteria bacterium]
LLEISTIKEQVQTLTDFMLAINGNDFVTKDADGNVLLNGKLKAETLEGGYITISVVEGNAPIIGESEICSAVVIDVDEDNVDDCSGNVIPRDSDEDGKDDVTGDEMPLDENSDWIDDETGEGIVNNGTSAVVETEAVEANSKIFVTSKNVMSQPLSVTQINPGVGFTVEVAQPLMEKVKFDWWIIDVEE